MSQLGTQPNAKIRGGIQYTHKTDPLAIASIYKTRSLGENLALSPKREERDGLLFFTLDSYIPSEIISSSPPRIINYHFANVGKIVVDINEKRVDNTKTDAAHVIEKTLMSEFNKLFQDVEEIIRNQERAAWGVMSFCKAFLSPFYELITNLVTFSPQKQNLEDFAIKNLDKWLKPLTISKFATVENDLYVYPENKLLALQTTLKKKMGKNYNDFRLAELVVGELIAEHASYIKSELKTQPFQPYIDLTKSYYLATLEVGELIPLTTQEIFSKYALLGRSSRNYGFNTKERRKMKSIKVLSELIAGNVLDKVPDEMKIIGHSAIFDKIIRYRDSILTGQLELAVI